MSVSSVSAELSAASLAASGRFFLPGASAFADTLNIGQIIQGKVLRSYGSNRYLVAFGGDERVVESSTPLTTGELLHGRVVALGDRVELQRVYEQPHRARPSDATGTRPVAVEDADSSIDAVLQRYQVQLTAEAQSTLARAARDAADPEAMAMAGAMLSKLGLPVTGVLLDALYRAQIGTQGAGGAHRTMEPATLAAVPQVAVATSDAPEAVPAVDGCSRRRPRNRRSGEAAGDRRWRPPSPRRSPRPCRCPPTGRGAREAMPRCRETRVEVPARPSPSG
jgi:hypothetical protein